jgi:hypothetical protein
VKPLGHPTHLEAKAKGESSLSGKAGHDETHQIVCRSRPGWQGEGRIA